MPTSKRCQQCGKELISEGLFCPYCGEKQEQLSTKASTHEMSFESLGEAQTLTGPSSSQLGTLGSSQEEQTLATLESKQKLNETSRPQQGNVSPLGLLQPGTILGKHYEITNKIGEGGMGVVYKGIDLVMQRTVAIKMLHANLLGETGVRQRFLREGRLMSTLNHPHVVQVYDLVEDNRMLALVMEFVEGITLTEYLQQWGGKLPYAEILSLFVPILQAMEEAHNQGIIHRDLKPDNILLQRTQTWMFPKIADFGLAKIIEGTSYTVSGALLGTCMYMSPEQIQSERSLDHRADIYSLGITLYQMCTGRCPFQDTNHFALMMAHVQNEPPLPSKQRQDMPEALETLILEALVKQPEQRLDSCQSFQERLESALGTVEAVTQPLLEELPPKLEQADGSEMILIPGGDFLMGPKRRSVYLDPFYIDRYAVTNLQFRLFLDTTGYRPSDTSSHRFLAHWNHRKIPPKLENHPVIFVSWYDARAYAIWAGKSLPTEAQWEKAARGEKGLKYPWGRDDPSPERANFGRTKSGPVAVDAMPKGASPYGALGLAGNVWEWCEDTDNPDFYNNGPDHNPRHVIRDGKTKCVLRGGSWIYDARSLRTHTRKGYDPHYRQEDVGFRCVRLPTHAATPNSDNTKT